jgi:tetratricopeptide (TPR) repeat protein
MRCSSGVARNGSIQRALASAALSLLLTATLPAQQRSGALNDPGSLKDFSTAYSTAPGTGVLVLTVYSENSRTHLDRQALAKLVDLRSQAATWQTTEDTSQAVFTNVAFGSYDVEVSAVGYLSAHKEMQLMNQPHPLELSVVLQRDPAAANLDVAGAAMPAKARKETKHGVAALKSGNFKEAQKQLSDAYQLVPTNPDLNFLLGYLYFQKKDYARAGNYLRTATNLNPHNVQALTLLGRVGLERQDYAAARSALEQAVVADSENWLPHNLLADAYLRQKNFDKARDEAQVSIDKGKSKARAAQLVLGQALVGMGRDEEGVEALNAFLQDSPRHPMAGQVRNLIAEIRQYDSSPRSVESATRTEASLSGMDPLLALPGPGLSLKTWQPPGVDDLQPVLAAGVACPSEKVIDGAGDRVKQLVEDVSRMAAVEDLLHQTLDQMGNPIRTETRKFNYVASMSESEPGLVTVNEYRADKLNLAGYPDQIASTGFAALALVFHPLMRDNFEMTCEGLGGWHGQATWLVHFRQRDNRPSRIHSYKVGNQVYAVRLKGRAWISAEGFQIVRIESELVSPMPEIQLLSEHQIVEYMAVRFPKKNLQLWLPKSAEIYFDFRRHRYYRRHSFDHYMLFSVDSEEKRGEPRKTAPGPA